MSWAERLPASTVLTGGFPIAAAMGTAIGGLGIYTITQSIKAGEELAQKQMRTTTRIGSTADSLAHASRTRAALLIVTTSIEREMLSTQIADSIQYLKDGVENVYPLFMSDEGEEMIHEVDAIYPV